MSCFPQTVPSQWLSVAAVPVQAHSCELQDSTGHLWLMLPYRSLSLTVLCLPSFSAIQDRLSLQSEGSPTFSGFFASVFHRLFHKSPPSWHPHHWKPELTCGFISTEALEALLFKMLQNFEFTWHLLNWNLHFSKISRNSYA